MIKADDENNNNFNISFNNPIKQSSKLNNQSEFLLQEEEVDVSYEQFENGINLEEVNSLISQFGTKFDFMPHSNLDRM